MEEGQELVQTVVVAADILQALAEHPRPLSLAGLSRKLNMTSPRILRHLTTLVAIGYVERSDHEPLYTLGWKLAQLGSKAAQKHDLVQLAYPFLKTLQEDVGVTVSLSRLMNDHALVWICLESINPPHISVPPGTRLSLRGSSSGRVLLAAMDHVRRRHIIEAVHDDAEAPDMIADATDLERRLEHIRERGFDLHGKVSMERLFGMAAPIRNYDGDVVASLSLIGIATIATPKEADLISAMCATANRISDALGAKRSLP